MTEWANFYLCAGTAAATLIGLMFIAITFGARLVTDETLGLARSILSPILYHFGHALLISFASMIPRITVTALALTVLVTSIARACLLPRLYRELGRASHETKQIEKSDWLLSLVAPALLYLVFLVGGICELLGETWPEFAIAMGTAALIFLGAFNAWDMLLWMASKVRES